MTHDEIVNGVLAKLNELGYTTDVSLISEGLRFTEYIEVAIKDAVMQLDRVNPKLSTFFGDIYVLPDDFVSLIEIKADSWTKSVVIITEKDTPEYSIAMNKYTAPGKNRPMVIRESTRSIKSLPVETDEMVKMVYNAAYDGKSGINGDKESQMVVDLAASIAYKIFGDDKMSNEIVQ